MTENKKQSAPLPSALDTRYDPKIEEAKWQKFWDKQGIVKSNVTKGGDIYSIDTPPPTVSGRMHIGHAFSYTQGDFIARFHRMRGRRVFYPYGTDDNGLPTERLVEKMKNVRATTMDRGEFVTLCRKTLDEIKPQFIKDWKDLGISCDFEENYSTIDEHCVKTSQLSFVDLYEKGRVYQEETPISWCTQCQTAIAQAEFDNVELASTFNDIIFKVGGKDVVIATTRPELLAACVAVIAHPSDKRYETLFGKFATVPLFGHEVPIIADEKADPEKGTGIVMCCTFGDKTDIEWWRKHNLPLRVVFEKYGKMNKLAGKYEGLSIKDARKQIVEDLKTANLLVGQKPITHAVNTHERCSTELEFMKTKQWYIKVLDKKQELIEAGDKITWYPTHMKVRYVHWVENLQWDWCISRQRFFGVPFPVWHCKKCGMIKLAERSQLPVDPMKDKPKSSCACGGKDFAPELDVMDTWATSSVTPQIALNWAEGSKEFGKMFPMSVRFQAHDIIRTWAFYTIVKAVFHHNIPPWKNIMIAGHALDPHGKKMSKSKGNVVDPVQTIQKYCADALRFWAATSKLGDDLPFQEKELVTGMKFITKLWNASRFAIMHLQDYDMNKGELNAIDKCMLSKLARLIRDCTDSFEAYEYSRTKADAEKFFWHMICDNYLEIAKGRLYEPDKHGEAARRGAQYTTYQLILTTLKLMAPITPHITEAVYQSYFVKKEDHASIHQSEWPVFDKSMIDESAEDIGEKAIAIIAAVRKHKSDNDKSLNTPVKEIVIECSEEDQHRLATVFDDIKATCKAGDIVFGKGDVESAVKGVTVSVVL